ncbi:MAG: VWA domain-containing protein, partial [Saprospiraceae bacterium]
VPFVKIYEEERELTVMLVVDVSNSSFFGSKELLKSELITELSAVLAFSAVQNNDKVGLILFSDKIEKYIAPSKGRNQTLRIIRELVDHKPKSAKTSINTAVQFLNNVVKKKCICFLISDFLDENYEQSLRIAGRKNDLIAIHIEDPVERILPHAGVIKAIDPETGISHWVDTEDEVFRKKYSEFYISKVNKLKQVLGESKVDLIRISTDEDYVKALLKFFKSR